MLVGHNEVRRQVNGGIYEIHIHLPHTRTQMHARTHTSWTSAPSAFLFYLIYLIPSFRCNTLSIHRFTLAVVSINSLERDGLRQAEFCPCYVMDNRSNVGFLVHKDMGSAVLGCRPVSSRLNSIRLRTAPFNVTIIQVYAPTSGHDDNEVDNFYRQRQEIIDQTLKKDILAVQGDWNAKVGRDAQADWGDVCGPYCNAETNERCLRLLELATFNNLVLINTLGPNNHPPINIISVVSLSGPVSEVQISVV